MDRLEEALEQSQAINKILLEQNKLQLATTKRLRRMLVSSLVIIISLVISLIICCLSLIQNL